MSRAARSMACDAVESATVLPLDLDSMDTDLEAVTKEESSNGRSQQKFAALLYCRLHSVSTCASNTDLSRRKRPHLSWSRMSGPKRLIASCHIE